MVGPLDGIGGATSLTTLMCTSNYLSCEVPKMIKASALGEGFFRDPTAVALRQVGYQVSVDTDIASILDLGLPRSYPSNIKNLFETVKSILKRIRLASSLGINGVSRTQSWHFSLPELHAGGPLCRANSASLRECSSGLQW